MGSLNPGADDRHVGSVVIDALPEHATAAFDQVAGTFVYDGDPISHIEAFYQRPRLGPTVRATASDVPSRVTAHWRLEGDRAVVDYDTRLSDGAPSTVNGSLDVGLLYSPDGTGGDDPVNGRYIEAAAEGLPTWAGVAVDDPDRSIRWDAAGATDLVRVTTRNLVADSLAARATLMSVPANWDVSWGDNHLRFRALDGGEIGSAELALALDGDVPEPLERTWWATATFDEENCDVDASLRVGGIEHVEVYGGEGQPEGPSNEPSCFGGDDADASRPVFEDTETHPAPVDPIGPPTCLIPISGLDIDPAAPTMFCGRLDLDLGGAPLYVDGQVVGKADEHGTAGEFVRRVNGDVLAVPNSVRVVKTGTQLAVATSSPLGVQLTADIGWRAAFEGADDALPTRDPGVHAIDFACAGTSCRPETPAEEDSPFCHDDTCYGIRARANLSKMPTGFMLDLAPNATRVVVRDFRPVDGDRFAATVETRYMLDERVRVELTQHGVPDPVNLRFGPISLVRCDAEDTGLDRERCNAIEAETGLAADGFRIAIATAHAQPLGDLDLYAEIGDPATTSGALVGDATITGPPAELDLDLLLGRRTQIRHASASGIAGVTADLECRSSGQPTATAHFGLTGVPASMDLRGEIMVDDSDPDPEPDPEPPIGIPPPERHTYKRFPRCGDIFPASTYPNGDPMYRGHLTDACEVYKEVPIDDVGSGGDGERPHPLYRLDYLSASANTLSGVVSIGGDLGLDFVDERGVNQRGPNMRITANRVSVQLRELRPGAFVVVHDQFGLRMGNVAGANALAAADLTVSADIDIRLQRCQWHFHLFNGPVLAPRDPSMTIDLDGPIGASLSFDDLVGNEPTDVLPGLEIRVDNPRTFELRTQAPFLGAGFDPSESGYDRVGVRFHRPRLDIEIDLVAEVWADKQPWSNFVDPLDITVDDVFTTINPPVFVDDDEQDLIYTVHTDAALCRDLFVDPSMDDADEVDRIWRGEEGDRTTGFETSDLDHSYSFSFLPSFGSEDAAGGEGQFEDWQLSLLGATLIHPFDNPESVRMEWGPVCDAPDFNPLPPRIG